MGNDISVDVAKNHSYHIRFSPYQQLLFITSYTGVWILLVTVATASNSIINDFHLQLFSCFDHALVCANQWFSKKKLYDYYKKMTENSIKTIAKQYLFYIIRLSSYTHMLYRSPFNAR